jgi:hypothetical protein
MQITKIKFTKDRKVKIEYNEKPRASGDPDEYSISCSDEPRKQFGEALAALIDDVQEICELPGDYKTRIIVTGLSLDYGGDNGTMGAVLIGQMRLSHSSSPLNLITPHKIEDFYGETGDENQLLSDDAKKHIYKLIEEAEAYVRGYRAQGNLYDKPAEKEIVDKETGEILESHDPPMEMIKLTPETRKKCDAALKRLVDSTKDGTGMSITIGGKGVTIENGKVFPYCKERKHGGKVDPAVCLKKCNPAKREQCANP